MAVAPKLPIRNPQLSYPPDTDPVWTPARPEFSCSANSISLLMPYMEPYFVRSVGAALPRLEEALATQARAYMGQEMQHQRHHKRFNEILIGRYRHLSAVARLAERAYTGLERSRSLGFNLAFAAASETIAYSAARWSAAHRTTLFDGADPVVTELFVWHLAEEVEHKSMAFEVYQAVDGRRLRYVAAMITSLALVMAFVGAGTTVMLLAERRLWNPLAWIRLSTWAVTFAFELLPLLVMSSLPGFHPDQLADPLWFEVWLRELDGPELKKI